jgi:hyperosmotically inducible periplasmic protein
MDHDRDNLIVDYVKDQLEEKMQASSMDINVISRNGIVHLSGMVDLLSEKVFAEAIAKSINGVTRVENNLTVAMDSNITDKHIQKEVELKLRDNQYHDDLLNVGPKVDNGIVHLLGTVDTLDQKKLAMKYASEARGVKEVISDIKLNTLGQYESDEIKSTIMEMYSALDIDPRDVSVKVNEGVVTLGGRVNDSFQEELALEIAEGIGGVKKVINKLRRWKK